MKNESILFKPCVPGTSGHGGSLQGEIRASYAELVEMFGEPAFEGIGDKITTEFVIDYEYHDGITDDTEYGGFTLYDWRFGRNLNDDTEEITWNVGGRNFMDGVAASHAIDIFNNTDVRYGQDSAVLCHAQWHKV